MKLTFLLVGLTIIGVGLIWRFAIRYADLPFPAEWGWMLTIMDPLIPAQTIVNVAGLRAGEDVLDVGAGIGRVAIPAARRVGQLGSVTAMDVQPAMLARLEREAQRANVTIVPRLHHASEEQDYGTAQYDVIIMSDMLGEVRDPQRAITNAYCALRPGGRIVIAEVYIDPHFQRSAVVRQRVTQGGFCDMRVSYGVGGYYLTARKPCEE